MVSMAKLAFHAAAGKGYSIAVRGMAAGGGGSAGWRYASAGQFARRQTSSLQNFQEFMMD
jgi:hypothetical protein